MSKVFLIAGLGADTRVYNNIDLNEDEVISVDWIEPHITDTLKMYAQKLIIQYNITPNSIIIGNSLGGMIAIEIANILPIKKVILISSIKTIEEAPWYFSMFRKLPVYKLIPGKAFTSMGFLIKFAFGKMNAADTWLFNDMLKNSSPKFIKWAMGATLQWDNKTIPPNTYIITGDKDHVFDYRRIKDAIIVKGGTHIMVFDKAKEINKILKRILKK
ncbi:MAG: Pimeloyl-ACP methyl ester carboxylesterase [Mucilaginibacter sp.]|nr:Pimeloyl-ACP methyl ester carboxylesterase [Mucilaginibacter sp.]